MTVTLFPTVIVGREVRIATAGIDHEGQLTAANDFRIAVVVPVFDEVASPSSAVMVRS
ncbi:MAG: hypothetical protein R3F53_21620 [Gammaproteobacteria bacterium]